MTYLIDTDYVIDYLKGEQNASEVLTTLVPEGLSISIITYAEVYEGIYYGYNRAYYEQGLSKFLQGVQVLGITRSIARQFAILRGQLRATPQGKAIVQPKDYYDLFIAATALYHDFTLVARNIKDYNHIPSLKLYKIEAK